MTKAELGAGYYKTKQILTASPVELTILAYDVALGGCAREDVQKTLQALTVLRTGLDLEAAPDLGHRLYAIYQYCERCVRSRDFETPAKLLHELREAWLEVNRRARESATPIPATMAVEQRVGVLNVAG